MGKRQKNRRAPARKKFKVKRKIREHQKKVRKMAKKLAHTKRLKKDPGIPNLWPEKQRMLERMQKKQSEENLRLEQEKLEKQRAKESRAKFLTTEQEMFKLGYDSQQKYKEFQDKQVFLEEQEKLFENSSHRQTNKFYKDFKEVVKMSNIIIMVLDARDPLGCRSTQIEKQILSTGAGKKLILLLNKIDLVPQEVVQKWLDYLREEYPTYPFKCNTQKQKYNLGEGRTHKSLHGNVNNAPAHLRFGGKCLGKDNLVKVLKRYTKAPNDDVRKSITVGIIGFPNVGKSSVINSLKGKKVANVGNKPGITTQLSVFKYDSKIQFVDCPGIIFSRTSVDSDIILRNAVQIDKLDDTITPVDLIRKRCTAERLMKKYDIPYFKTTEEFLARLAHKKGKLLKGGKPNLHEMGKIVLKDWNEGRIPFFTLPPNRPRFLNNDDIKRAEIQWGVVDDNSVLKKIKTFQDKEMENLIPMLSSLSIK